MAPTFQSLEAARYYEVEGEVEVSFFIEARRSEYIDIEAREIFNEHLLLNPAPTSPPTSS